MKFIPGKDRSGAIVSPKNPVVIAATVLHKETGESFFEWHYPHLTGEISRELTPRGTAPKVIATSILNNGGAMPSDYISDIEKLVQDAYTRKNDTLLTITGRCGWHGKSFVDWYQTYGPEADSLIFDWRQWPGTCRKGKFKAWRTGLGPACSASSYITFGIALAFAAPLLDIAGEEESWGFYMHGRRSDAGDERKRRSSSGKSTTVRAMLSTMERGGVTDLTPFAITERALAELCARRNDRAVGIDEAGRAGESTIKKKEKMAQMAYAVGSGVGKVISEKVARELGLPNLVWRTLALCTGEPPLDCDLGEAREEGEQVRLMGIPVPPGYQSGIFDRLRSNQSANGLMSDVKKTIKHNHGHALPRFHSKIVPMRSELKKRVRKEVDDFCAGEKAVEVPWEFRFASRFGLVSAAAVIAAELKIAPWTVKHARRSVLRMYRRARKAAASKSGSADVLLANLREACREGKFPIVEKGKSVPKSARSLAVGIRRTHPKHGMVLAIPRVRLEEFVLPRILAKAVMKDLVRKGTIVKAGDGKLTHQIDAKGLGDRRKRFVCFPMAALSPLKKS